MSDRRRIASSSRRSGRGARGVVGRARGGRRGRDVRDDDQELESSQREMGGRVHQGRHLHGGRRTGNTRRPRQVHGDGDDGHVRSRARERVRRSGHVRVEEVGEDDHVRPQARARRRARHARRSSGVDSRRCGSDEPPTCLSRGRHGDSERGRSRRVDVGDTSRRSRLLAELDDPRVASGRSRWRSRPRRSTTAVTSSASRTAGTARARSTRSCGRAERPQAPSTSGCFPATSRRRRTA